MNFCITGLPRSRTKWFAEYFTACGHPCVHEGMNGCESVDEYEDLMGRYEGNSDCGIPFYPFDGKTVIIERNYDDVLDSLYQYFGDVNLMMLKGKLDKLKGLRVKFEDINDRLKEIHEYCVGDTYSEEIAERYKNMNIQVDMNNYQIDEKSLKLIGELSCLG